MTAWNRTGKLGVAALFLLIGSTSLLTAQTGWHVDSERGFKFKPPAKWEDVPIDIDEKWIVAKYLSDRSYSTRAGTYSVDHRPLMRVIVFPDEAQKEKGLTAKVSGSTIFVGMNNPYKDYKHYLKETRSGFYLSKDEEGDGKSGPAAKIEATFDKNDVKYRLVTWIFRAEDASFAVEFELVDEHFQKLAPFAAGAQKSFRFIDREGVLVAGTTPSAGGPPNGASTDDLTVLRDRKAWKARSPADRAKAKKRIEESRIHRMEAAMTAGWSVRKTKNCVILSHVDDKYTQAVADGAEACRSFLDDSFEKVSDEYVMRSIIRICKDWDEYRAYRLNSGGSFDPNDREIVTFKDVSGGRQGGLGWMLSGIARQYLYDKDAFLFNDMPIWFSEGLDQAMSTAAVKGRDLEFGPDTWENDGIREAKKAGKMEPASKLLRMTRKEFYEGEGRARTYQCARLVRWIIAGGGRTKTFKGFLCDFPKLVIQVGEQLDAEEKPAEPRKNAETEAEEEARYKEQREAGGARERTRLDRIIEAMGWSAQDWETTEKALQKACD